jgi:hypothetical protein
VALDQTLASDATNYVALNFVTAEVRAYSTVQQNIYWCGRTFVSLTLQSGKYRRSQWPRGLGSGSAAACLLGLRVRIPPEAWMSVSC